MSKSLGQVVAETIVCFPLAFLPDSTPEPTPEERIAEAIAEIQERKDD